MSADLDLDDVAYMHPVAQMQLRDLRADADDKAQLLAVLRELCHDYRRTSGAPWNTARALLKRIDVLS